LLDDHHRAGDHRLKIPLVFSKPIEEQQQRIDLVVVATTGEGEKFVLEIGEPEGLRRQEDATRFKAALLPAHAGHLVDVRIAAHDIETGHFL